jgi:hypothetical protein
MSKNKKSLQTVTLNNTNQKLNYDDEITDIEIQGDISEPVWEINGRYFVLVELCKGLYQSGKKQGQRCWKCATSWRTGYCWKHARQYVPEKHLLEDLESSSSESDY